MCGNHLGIKQYLFLSKCLEQKMPNKIQDLNLVFAFRRLRGLISHNIRLTLI